MRRQILMCFLLMVSLLLQVEAVFACASMDGSDQSRCCCPDTKSPAGAAQHDCDVAQESVSGPCCASGLARCWVAADMAAGTDHTLVPDPLRLSAPPPAAALIVQPPADQRPSKHPKSDSDWFAGTDTYLITRRLRD